MRREEKAVGIEIRNDYRLFLSCRSSKIGTYAA